MRIVLTHRPDPNFNPMFVVLKTGRDFQYRPNSHFSLNPSFLLVKLDHLEEECICVGCAIVQADNAPDCGVALGFFHGVTVRHGENQEEEEGEVEQEVEGQEEENAQTPVRMSMDEME